MTKNEIEYRATKWLSMVDEKYLNGLFDCKLHNQKVAEIKQWTEQTYKRYNINVVETL